MVFISRNELNLEMKKSLHFNDEVLLEEEDAILLWTLSLDSQQKKPLSLNDSLELLVVKWLLSTIQPDHHLPSPVPRNKSLENREKSD